MNSRVRRFLAHPAGTGVFWLLVLWPGVGLVVAAALNALGANPAEALIRSTGDWTLRFLCVTLAVTPLRLMLGWPELARRRRGFGLTTYAYASLHLFCYAWLDMGLLWPDLLKDIAKRNFIAVGMLAWVLLSLLAASSFKRVMRWLGGMRWQRLHRAVHAVALMGLLHFFWMRSGKQDFAEVAVYALILGSLLAWRVWHATRPRR